MRVLLYSTAHLGHLMPTAHLAEGLSTLKGFTVCLAAAECRRAKCAARVEAAGGSFHGLASEIDEAICLQMGPPAIGLKGPLVYYCAEQELAPLQAAVAAFKPDVLVADLFGLAGFWIAEAQHDLPLVINMPANYAIYNMITTVIPKLYAVLRCLPCLRPRHMSWEAVRFMREEMRPRIAKAHAGDLVILLNSIWAIDAPTPPAGLPPSVVMTGPLFPLSARAHGLSAANPRHAPLLRWLDSTPSDLPLVYITTGTQATLDERLVRVLHDALSLCRCVTCWSLKEAAQAHLPAAALRGSDRLFVASWIPQLELMRLPRLACVVSHCGWGGVLETASAGKPVVSIPFFGDQPANAKLLRQHGCAITVDHKRCTANAVATAVSRVLDEPSFKANAEKVQQAMLQAPGIAAAAAAIEAAAGLGKKV